MTVNCKYYFYLILFLSSSTYLFAQSDLHILKRQFVADDYLIDVNKISRDTSDLNTILNQYKTDFLTQGYVSAGFDSVVVDTSEIFAYFTTGSKFNWDEFDFVVPNEFKNVYEKKILRRKVFDINSLQKVFMNALEDAANKGYPFASIIMDSLAINSDSLVYARFKLDEGQRFYFDSLHIKSDTKIRQHYIESYLEIKKSDVFSMEKINQIENKIKNLKFIEQTRPFQLAFGDDNADILLYLKKRKSNSFNGMIGILPNNKTTGKLLVTGDINLYLLNSVGAGELFAFKWQKFELLSQNLKTEFSLPYLFRSQFGVGVKFDIEKKDSSYVNTDFTGRLIYGSNTANGTEFFFRRKTSYLLGKEANYTDANYSGFSSNLFGVSYRFIQTDNNLSPRSGIILDLSTSFGTKNQQNEEEIKPIFQNISFAAVNAYIPLFSYMSIKLRSYTSMIYSEKIFENELDRIGGLNTIRGFDELSLPVSSYSIFNTELRYLFEEQSALFLFYDIAYTEKRFTIEDSYNVLMGVGAGLDLNTNAGVFSIIFAVGKQNENPFLFNSSKIHFGYRSTF
ncbi:MAG: ShlB/FhaC/HecB family hemolysin secretion/activation protein [Bacteroidales bacterium]|nr:ShlB/FhaC/HecB family hemolysin secretion/activation protein [Bacteroidales bacterium]